MLASGKGATMCFTYDALPPDLPHHHAGDGGQAAASDPNSGVASTQGMVLTSRDGTQFAAFAARPASPTGAGIVILPDVRGLFRFYEELAKRFAVAGVEAVAID